MYSSNYCCKFFVRFQTAPKSKEIHAYRLIHVVFLSGSKGFREFEICQPLPYLKWTTVFDRMTDLLLGDHVLNVDINRRHITYGMYGMCGMYGI